MYNVDIKAKTNKISCKNKTESEKRVMKKIIIRILTLALFVSILFAFASPVALAATNNKYALNKTATELTEDLTTEVTLSVGADQKELGVDIIYILGGFLSKEKVESNIMISCLTDTFREIISRGTTVNFGVVPYSSTKDPVLPLTKLETLEDLEALPELLAQAIEDAGDVYDQVNMENALVTAKQMFSESPLAGKPDRQHLVMIASGHTYYFNSGENNQYVSTVPVNFISTGGVDAKALFHFPEKAWMRARNNNTNSYPIPYHIVNEYNTNPDKYASLWDCYWSYIDQWARADIAAGDSVVYEVATREEGNFMNWINNNSVYHSDQSSFKYSGNGYVIKGFDASELEDYVTIDFRESGTITAKSGPNPLKVEGAAHAILNERAMWEAYEYLKSEITGSGINFYPIYNHLRDDHSTSNGSNKYCDYTDQYIGHSFMNMLAGGEAVIYSSTDNKAFFDPIKNSIVYNIFNGTCVEDYIGYAEDEYNFDVITEKDSFVLTLNGTQFITEKKAEPTEGATATYEFKKDESSEATFSVDYFYGNGKDTERFVWNFGQELTYSDVITLTYKLALTTRVLEPGQYEAETNISAVIYPKNSDGIDGTPEVFPIPVVNYKNVAPAQVVIEGVKYLDNEAAEGFEFALTENDDVIATAVSGKDGVFKFDAIEFAKAGSYTYKVYEIAGEDEDIIYDDSVFSVVIEIAEEDCVLKADVTALEGNDEKALEFYNETVFELEEPEVPLAPGTDTKPEPPKEELKGDYEELEDPEVPMADAPVKEEAPKEELPKTGDINVAFFAFVAILVLFVGGIALGKKNALNK